MTRSFRFAFAFPCANAKSLRSPHVSKRSRSRGAVHPHFSGNRRPTDFETRFEPQLSCCEWWLIKRHPLIEPDFYLDLAAQTRRCPLPHTRRPAQCDTSVSGCVAGPPLVRGSVAYSCGVQCFGCRQTRISGTPMTCQHQEFAQHGRRAESDLNRFSSSATAAFSLWPCRRRGVKWTTLSSSRFWDLLDTASTEPLRK